MSGILMPQQRDTSITTTLLKGLQAAQAVMGIRKDMKESDALDEKRADADRKARGEFTPAELAPMYAEGTISDKETPGSTPIKIAPPRPAEDSGGIIDWVKNKLGADDETALRTPDQAQQPQQSLFLGAKAKEAKQQAGSWRTVPDPVTGKPVQRYVADVVGTELPGYEKPEQREDKTATTSAELRKEYTSHPTTKNTEAVIANVSKIDKIVQNPNPTGASDIALVYAFMRAQDPNSSVREGEYATAENSGGISATVAKLYNGLLSGQRLTPDVRQNFAVESRRLLEAQLGNQAAIDDQYANIARNPKINVDPNLVVNPNFAKARELFKNPEYLTPKHKGAPAAGEAQASEAPPFDPKAKYPVGTIRQHEGTSELEQLNANGQWLPYKAPAPTPRP